MKKSVLACSRCGSALNLSWNHCNLIGQVIGRGDNCKAFTGPVAFDGSAGSFEKCRIPEAARKDQANW
jgi:hypothetical protein